MILVICLGVLGAAFLGAGFVAQQREASRIQVGDGFSVRLLTRLMRRRVWWAGIASMAIGYLLVGWTLGSGNLVLVEPLIAANLLFALPVAAVWCRRRPSLRAMLGAVALAGGVTGFVVVTHPHGGRFTAIPDEVWVLAAAAISVLVGGSTALGLLKRGAARAGLLGIATGATYGMQDSLTRRVYGGLEHGLAGLVGSWPLWALIVVGTLGVLLAQNAFDAAPLTASLPAISVTEPIVGIGLGIAVFESHVRMDPLSLALGALCFSVMLIGAFVVSRDHVVHHATAGEQAAEHELAA